MSEFSYDVFLSHSSKDKAVVRGIAERLRADGLRVWFDEFVIKPGDSIPARIEDGLEQSRVLVLCMSASAFGSDWATLESGTFRFRDPLNKERRFIPLRLDEAPIKGSLAQFFYIKWGTELEYPKLLDACRPPAKPMDVEAPAERGQVAEKAIQLDYKEASINAYAFSPNGKRALSGGDDNTVRLWNLETGRCLRVLEGHTQLVVRVAWSANQRNALSASDDGTVRLWDVEAGRCLRVLKGHSNHVWDLAWSADQHRVLSVSWDRTMRLWDVETGECVRVFEGHSGYVISVAWSADQRYALSGSVDKTVRLWDVETGGCLRVFEGHTANVLCVVFSPDGRRFLSSGDTGDNTVRLWDLQIGECQRKLEGHTVGVSRVEWSAGGRSALSCGGDETLRLWDLETGRCLRVLESHTRSWVRAVAWSADQRHAFSGDRTGCIRVWDLLEFVAEVNAPRTPATALSSVPDQVQYTNAKVLLVGDSSAGKTGLSMRLALNDWQPSDSTVGAWATQMKLPVSSEDGMEREIWLWDFGGQADQRLIHQLYMEDTALAVLVFDGQKEDLFETLGQWDRDLTRASRKPFTKVLAAGRVDAGGLRVSRSQLETFAKERGFDRFLETSAKANLGCEELKDAILAGIHWADIPWRSSPVLFKRLKEEIIRLKDEGRVLMRFNELRDSLRLKLAEFKDEELKAVVGLLAGPGVVWELEFGSWVLLQPERINAYAQAVIQTLREDEDERGCLPEERVLEGRLSYHSSIQRLPGEEERFVLLAVHQTLVERGLCLREHTDKGPLLIFPSYYRRKRPELVGHPAVLVSYRFNGFLDDIYATLVVRLHHTKPFQQDQLWRYAADFKTLAGKQLGVKMTRLAEGAGELQVYFDPAISEDMKILFSTYVHEHLLEKGQEVVRLRHYVCPHCGTPAGNREVAMRKLEEGKKDIPCVNCDDPKKRIPLWDKLEELFASPEMKQRVRELQEQSALVLDNESKERALVGEVISTVALAGQICREFNVSDYGIDMAIEFKNDAGEATGRQLYLVVKSADCYSDETRAFTIRDESHASYWMKQAFPVLLVIRTSEGEVRWMEVRDKLKSAEKPVKQIVFTGERFDVMAVRRWREKALSLGQ